MHILITADTVGGVWIYTQELVTGLLRRGMNVTLVTFGEIPGHDQTQWMEGLAGLDFRPTAFALEWMHNVQADMEASQRFLESLINEVQPDLLHFNQYFYGAMPGGLPRLITAHSDVLSWWIAVHGQTPPDSRWLDWYRGMVVRGLAHATAVICPSQAMLDSLSRHYGRPGNAFVIYNGRDPSRFNPHVTKETFVLSVGRLWDSGKQVALLCQPDLPMDAYIVGSDRHPDATLRSQSGLRPAALARVHFRGAQTEAQLRHLYGRAAIYAATSRYEPFGLAPLEAALSRCALIANDIPTFRELWGDSAFYFELNDAGGLNLALQQLTSNSWLRQDYADRAYQRAVRRFASNRMVENYLSVYHTLVPAPALAA